MYSKLDHSKCGLELPLEYDQMHTIYTIRASFVNVEGYHLSSLASKPLGSYGNAD